MQPPWPAVFRAPPTKEVLMTTLREKMMQDLKLAGYAVKTQRTYLDAIGDLAKFCWSPAELGQEQVRDWVERLTKSKVGPPPQDRRHRRRSKRHPRASRQGRQGTVGDAQSTTARHFARVLETGATGFTVRVHVQDGSTAERGLCAQSPEESLRAGEAGQEGDAAHAASFVRHEFARERHRPSCHPGAARPREHPFDDALRTSVGGNGREDQESLGALAKNRLTSS